MKTLKNIVTSVLALVAYAVIGLVVMAVGTFVMVLGKLVWLVRSEYRKGW